MSIPQQAAPTTPALLRILLAEDHEQMRELLKLVLKGNYDVIAALRNGRDLLDAANRRSPDLVVTDISMPVVDGFTAGRILRAQMLSVPLIFVTHHAEAAYLEEAVRIGVRGYVLKTRIVQDLRLAIREVWQGGMFLSPSLPWVTT